MAANLAERGNVASRIKALRGPRPQPLIAAEVGVTLRAYQSWEAGGGIAWPNLQRLAEIHGVSTNWLEHGDEKPHAARSQLDRIEHKLDEVLGRLGALEVGDLFATDELGSARDAQKESRGRREG
jgi:hypothetical protein